MVAGDWRIPRESVQPASVDLRLGEHAWALRCSFLPDSDSTVEEKIEDLAFDRIDLRDGATLERDRPYLVPLIEELRLPAEIRAKANPKSSTGRLDVFTRVLTDRSHRFDEIAAGYHGRLYLEVVPRTFAIRVKTGLALNQVRLIGGDARLSDEELVRAARASPLLYLRLADRCRRGAVARRRPVREPRRLGPGGEHRRLPRQEEQPADRPDEGGRAALAGLLGARSTRRAAGGSCSSPRSSTCCCRPRASASHPHTPRRCSPTTRPRASCAPTTPASSTPASDTRAAGGAHGSRAALEVRARDVSFMVEHRQPVCKLAFERMAEEPDVLYGEDVGSNYQGQQTMLSKHFVAGAGRGPQPGSTVQCLADGRSRAVA